MTIVSLVIDAFGTVTNGLLKGLDDVEVSGRVEIIQTVIILRGVLETWVNLLSLKP